MIANCCNLLYSNFADQTAVASSAIEATLMAGTNRLPVVPRFTFTDYVGRALRVTARGVFSNTGTPTMTFIARLGTTAGSSFLTGTAVATSAAITTTSAVTNVQWAWVFELVNRTAGTGTGNTTLSGAGLITSPAGFAAPYSYATPDSATWTGGAIDGGLDQYLNLTLTWGSSSASNTCTLKSLLVEALG